MSTESLANVSTRDLVRELLLREPGGNIRIEIGTIMSIESYHPGVWNKDDAKWDRKPIEFQIVAESHDPQTFANVDEAVAAFFRWWKRADEVGRRVPL